MCKLSLHVETLYGIADAYEDWLMQQRMREVAFHISSVDWADFDASMVLLLDIDPAFDTVLFLPFFISRSS